MRLHLGLRKKNEPTTPQLWGNRADRPVTNPAKPTNSVPYFNGRSIWKKRRIFLECGRVLFLSEVKRTEWDERPVGAWRSPMKKTNRSEKRPLKVEVVKPGSDRNYPGITGYRNRTRNSRYRPVKQHPTHGGIEPRPSRTNQKVLKVTTYKLKASS